MRGVIAHPFMGMMPRMREEKKWLQDGPHSRHQLGFLEFRFRMLRPGRFLVILGVIA